MKTTRAFTLIELMVVISIISMLASVVLASLKPIRAQAMDAKRKQEIHSIDLAIQQYIADKGYPPELNGCSAQVPYAGGVLSGCVAVSTDGLNGYPTNQTPNTTWGLLAKQLSPYIPVIPSDPCTGGCLAEDGVTPLAYTYMAPAAVQYYSGGSNSSYQLSAVLQTGSNAPGSTGGNVSTVDTLAPNTPSNFHASIVIGSPDPVTHMRTDNTTYSWSAATDNGFSGIAGYQVYLDGVPRGTPTASLYGGYYRIVGITSNSQTQCWSVASIDNAGNVSQPTAQQCFVDPPNTLPDTTPPSVPVGVTTGRNGTTIQLQWVPSTDNYGGSGIARYQVYLGASLYTTVTTTNVDASNLSIAGGPNAGQYCWSVKAIDNSGNASALSSPAVCLY